MHISTVKLCRMGQIMNVKKALFISLALVLISSVALSLSLLLSHDEQTPSEQDEPCALSSPRLILTESGAAWQAVEFAIGYEVMISDEVRRLGADTLSVSLRPGELIKVRALGDGKEYSASEWSSPLKYTIRLSVPIVSVARDGRAEWSAVFGAVMYECNIDGNVTLTEECFTNISYGQSLSVRAIGDGDAYLDGEWSAAKTLDAPVPEFMYIKASLEDPTKANKGTRDLIADEYLGVIDAYLENEDNHFSKPLPEQGSHSLHVEPTDVICIEIWLLDIGQCEFVSFKLNGIRYTRDNGMNVYREEKNDVCYTCLYIETQIPQDARGAIDYTVSDIEYKEELFIDNSTLESKNTVTVAAPKDIGMRVFDIAFREITYNSVSLSFNIGTKGAEEAADPWLGIALFCDRAAVCVKELSIGENLFSEASLRDDTEYTVIVFLYADLFDGSGVSAHMLSFSSFITDRAISFDLLSTGFTYDREENKYYPTVNIRTDIKDGVSYLGLEIFDRNGNSVYKNDSFGSTLSVSDGILCGSEYTVRVRYSVGGYEKYTERGVSIPRLSELHIEERGYYYEGADLIFYFRAGNYTNPYPYIKALRFLLYDKSSLSYLAAGVLRILDNEGAVDEAYSEYLRAKDALLFVDKYTEAEEYNRLMRIAESCERDWQRLREAEEIFYRDYAEKTDREFWESAFAEGEFIYDISFPEEKVDLVRRVGDTYYIRLTEYIGISHSADVAFRLTVTLDRLDGEEPEEVTLLENTADFG